MNRIPYHELEARERIAQVTDSFSEILPPPDRVMSPYLPELGIPVSFDDGLIIGKATVDGNLAAARFTDWGQQFGPSWWSVRRGTRLRIRRAICAARRCTPSRMVSGSAKSARAICAGATFSRRLCGLARGRAFSGPGGRVMLSGLKCPQTIDRNARTNEIENT